jgi:hypothetical protein
MSRPPISDEDVKALVLLAKACRGDLDAFSIRDRGAAIAVIDRIVIHHANTLSRKQRRAAEKAKK